MPIADKYAPSEIESKWYDYWIEHRLFHSEPDRREPYTIVIPPPNVTGMLHMGHMLNNTLQDVLVRRARMAGKNACWVPGTDHASIATEAKVVAKLKAEGIEKSSLTREEFLSHAWAWKEQYGGMILKQLRKLGASCDWERTCFTMDDTRTEGVLKVFCDLYRKGKIYRGVRMVNWDPAAQTALSDEEVVFKESHGKLYYLRYPILEDSTNLDSINAQRALESRQYIIVATTRPETFFGDSAVMVNPNDERYKHFIGKSVILPLLNRPITIIADSHVDMEFGTGCVKVTPAHDVNDYEVGKRHNLQSIVIFNQKGILNAEAGEFEGQDRLVARPLIVQKLEELGFIEKIEDYTNQVGKCYRCGNVVEPYVSKQWFVKKEVATNAIKKVNDKELHFFPPQWLNNYNAWMK